MEVTTTLDNQDRHLFDLDILPEDFVLAGLHSSHDATTTFASFSNDVEDLKFFTQYCSSFSRDLGESSHDSARTSSSLDSPIPIATPVPLPYSARSSEVLESMISGPKGAYSLHNDTLAHSLTLAEKLEREQVESSDSVFKGQYDEMLTKHDCIRSLAENQPLPSKAVFRPIRPVSPSTLIALTEPCLMAWSTRLPLSPLPMQGPRSTIHLPRQDTRIVPSPAMRVGWSSWGY
ncbi:hypothetical protein C0992_003579 [Termitomyces sp. T32_za158]|nr:hypothetical protein C0992_003579 [Termitomyces sp. T32_za158]